MSSFDKRKLLHLLSNWKKKVTLSSVHDKLKEHTPDTVVLIHDKGFLQKLYLYYMYGESGEKRREEDVEFCAIMSEVILLHMLIN